MEARQQIVEIAESHVAEEVPLELTAEEERLLEQAQEDFRQGRTIGMEEFKAEMDGFMGELRARSKWHETQCPCVPNRTRTIQDDARL